MFNMGQNKKGTNEIVGKIIGKKKDHKE